MGNDMETKRGEIGMFETPKFLDPAPSKPKITFE